MKWGTGFTFNTYCMLLNVPPERIAAAFKDMEPVQAHWCSTTGGYVWGANRDKTHSISPDAFEAEGELYDEEWDEELNDYVPVGGVKHDMFQFSIEQVKKHGTISLHEGEANERELRRVIKGLRLPSPLPKKITDDECAYCDAGRPIKEWREKYDALKKLWQQHDAKQYELATKEWVPNRWYPGGGFYAKQPIPCRCEKVCEEFHKMQNELDQDDE